MSKNSRRENPRKLRRQLRFESMESRRVLAADVFQHNFDLPDDVNGDQFVSPIDALAVINHLNSSSSHSPNISNSLVSGESAREKMYLDVNADGFVSPMDALSIINALNSNNPSKTNSSKTAPATNAANTAPTSAATISSTTTPTPSTNFDDDNANEGDEASESAETVSQRLVSTLQGTGEETGRVVFESGTESGAVQNELEVRVRNSTPSSTLDVVINGVTVGSVSTDASGNGKLHLATVPNGTSELPLPADFPAVAAAATVLIGTTMTGTLAEPTGTNPCVNHEGHGEHDHEGHDGGGSREASKTQVASILAGTGAQLGYVQFESEMHRGTLKTELGISVNSLTPNASLDVIIDGITVGQIVTDADGHGDLDLSSQPHGTNELPLPADFPVIAAGSTIQIGTELTGTFTARPNKPTLPTTTTLAAITLQPQRSTSIRQGNSHHRSHHR